MSFFNSFLLKDLTYNIMFIYKCDLCKKVIKNKEEMVVAGTRRVSCFELCAKCGEPIENFLKKKKLINEK